MRMGTVAPLWPTLDSYPQFRLRIIVMPGMTLLLFVLAFNLNGDAFREALDRPMSARV